MKVLTLLLASVLGMLTIIWFLCTSGIIGEILFILLVVAIYSVKPDSRQANSGQSYFGRRQSSQEAERRWREAHPDFASDPSVSAISQLDEEEIAARATGAQSAMSKIHMGRCVVGGRKDKFAVGNSEQVARGRKRFKQALVDNARQKGVCIHDEGLE